MENNPKYEFDDWVGAVRPDPKNTDQLTVLEGYLGASSEAGHIRVYTDEALNSFVEVPEDAILYSVKITPAESSLGGSKLWLRADAVVTFGDPKLANRPKSTFLEGDIMQQYSAFGQPDTTQMTGFMAGQGDTTGPGAQVTAICQISAQCQITKPKVNCPPVFAKTVLKPCIPNLITKVTCFKTCAFCPPFQTPISLACNPGNPGGPIGQPGAYMGQPDTTGMGGYYGTFNPYMY